jgi:hypothetical protein
MAGQNTKPQKEIVRRVETLFKLADEIEKRVEAATQHTDKLTQASPQSSPRPSPANCRLWHAEPNPKRNWYNQACQWNAPKDLIRRQLAQLDEIEKLHSDDFHVPSQELVSRLPWGRVGSTTLAPPFLAVTACPG